MKPYYKDNFGVIYNENCMDTMHRMADNSVDVSFTSPPYNRRRNDKYLYYDDIVLDYFNFLKAAIDGLIRVTKGNVFVNLMKNITIKKMFLI